jgi:uncharacterized Zn-finger protein
MTVDTDLDCKYNDEPVCPYCGHIYTDAWELGDCGDGTEVECGKCEKEFKVFSDRHITYNTYKLEQEASK